MNNVIRNIYISSQLLLEYVKRNEVVWQMRGSLVELSDAKNEKCLRGKQTDSEIRNNDMLSVIAHAHEAYVFNPNSDDHVGFEELVEWSNENDLLILIDDELMLCIASCDKEQVLAMAA